MRIGMLQRLGELFVISNSTLLRRPKFTSLSRFSTSPIKLPMTLTRWIFPSFISGSRSTMSSYSCTVSSTM